MLDKLFLLLHLTLLQFAANENCILMFSTKQIRKQKKVRSTRIYLERLAETLAAMGSKSELRFTSNFI